jgi:small GTP-binding protein
MNGSAIQKKVCMIGVPAVGKTSLVNQFVYRRFSEKYLSTIGTTISRKEVQVDRDGQSVDMKLIIWDLAGTESFSWVMKSYYRGAAGAIMVCDLTRPESLNALVFHFREFKKANPGASFVIAGNKNDLTDQRLIDEHDLQDLASAYNCEYYLSSAKTGEHVDSMFYTLADSML